MPAPAKILVLAGIALVALGLLWWLGGRWLGWLGRLPGDIRIEGEKGGFYFPVTTCILLSIAFTLILSLIRKFF